MMTGYWIAKGLNVAAELGLADLLRDGPRRSDQLAAACGAHPPTLYRLLGRWLASAYSLRSRSSSSLLPRLLSCCAPTSPAQCGRSPVCTAPSSTKLGATCWTASEPASPPSTVCSAPATSITSHAARA